MVIFGDTIVKGDLASLARSQHSALVCSEYSASQAGVVALDALLNEHAGDANVRDQLIWIKAESS